jgi:hypothetical protein
MFPVNKKLKSMHYDFEQSCKGTWNFTLRNMISEHHSGRTLQKHSLPRVTSWPSNKQYTYCYLQMLLNGVYMERIARGGVYSGWFCEGIDCIRELVGMQFQIDSWYGMEGIWDFVAEGYKGRYGWKFWIT